VQKKKKEVAKFFPPPFAALRSIVMHVVERYHRKFCYVKSV
jgi:ribosomal protein L13E